MCFGSFPIDESALGNIDNRYYLAFLNNKLIVMSGLVSKTSSYYGLEISFTCTDPNYKRHGIMTLLINKTLENIKEDVYCECCHYCDKNNCNYSVYLWRRKL